MAYPWRGEWEEGVYYRPNEPGNSWAHYWDVLVRQGSDEDPFFFEEYQDPQRDGEPKIRYKVLIEEGKGIHQIVYYNIHDLETATRLTVRLNNAVYRWIVKGRRQNE